jgi:hypothetical protein
MQQWLWGTTTFACLTNLAKYASKSTAQQTVTSAYGQVSSRGMPPGKQKFRRVPRRIHKLTRHLAA